MISKLFDRLTHDFAPLPGRTPQSPADCRIGSGKALTRNPSRVHITPC
jgi:hypothetical protein